MSEYDDGCGPKPRLPMGDTPRTPPSVIAHLNKDLRNENIRLQRDLSAAQKRIEELEGLIAGLKELKITQTLNSYETNQVYPGLIIRK